MLDDDRFKEVDGVLENAVLSGQLRAAVLYARIGNAIHHQAFGDAKSVNASFLLGSISKPIAVAAFMTLMDQGKFGLDDLVKKYVPEFTGESRDRVTIRHLLTHVSGLADQLPENAILRKAHAPLSDFIKGTVRAPLHFEPGTKYEYSSMAILLATEIAQRISGVEFKEFVDQVILQPLGMTRTAFGMGRLNPADTMACQVEFGAIESGGGSIESSDWDWNSSYWRNLGAPWGGAQSSALDVGLFLDLFLHPRGNVLHPVVANLMIQNHNPVGIVSRGLGFEVGMNDAVFNYSSKTFGHTGSTGTIAWADPERDRVCVVLTTLPAGLIKNHPRQLASDLVVAILE